MTTTRIDWQAAHARLEALSRAIESGGEPSPEDARRILEERARRLAQPREEVIATAESTGVLVFSRAGQRYGVPARQAREVLPKTAPTPLPGTRPGLAGVAHHRGRVLAVVDVGGLRGNPSRGLEGWIVAVEAKGAAVGLLADEIAGIVPVAPGEVTAGGQGNERWVRGTTADFVTLLDLETLLEDPRVRVEE